MCVWRLVPKGQLRHPMLMPVHPSNQELLAKLQELGSINLKAFNLDKNVDELKAEAAKHRRLLGMKKQGSLQNPLRLPCRMYHAVHVCWCLEWWQQPATPPVPGQSKLGRRRGVWDKKFGQLVEDQLARWKGQVRRAKCGPRASSQLSPHLPGGQPKARHRHPGHLGAVWEVYLDPKWARQQVGKAVRSPGPGTEQRFKKLEKEMAELSMKRQYRAKQLWVFLGAAGIGTGGGWGGDVVLRACCKVVCWPRGQDQRRGRVVLVDEHRTNRLSSAVNGQQPCDRPADSQEGQVELRLLRPAWSQQREQLVRDLMWCPIDAKRKVPQPPCSQEATQPSASEPEPSTPPPAKCSKRTKAKQTIEPTRPTKAKGQSQASTTARQHLLTALLPDMPPVKKVTRISRANGAKAKARHEAAKSMEQLTAAHATLTAAHAALNADLLSSREQYSQLREWHRSLLVSAGQREQQWELDLLGWVQQLQQLEEAFLQQLQGTQAQLTDTAAALEAAQKDLAAARTELAHTKQQLTTTNIKLEQLRAQVDAANKGFSKDHKDKWNLLMRSRVSLPFLRGMLSSQGTKPATQPACHPATRSSSLARPRNQECDTHTGGYTAEYILSRDAMIGSINNKLDPGALANIDLADFEARLLTLRKQKRDKETNSADDNREAKAARKAEESACMVDGNAKMVLNVPTQAPLQQLQQAFQQHARGADYSNTSAKEATRFTREQLRAYLLYHKVPPRDQPVGNTLVAGWQKAVQKHIAERGSPTGHRVLP
ncbi:hypothetical protein QJQ45_000572 [Haematococcus lacustris]|nr:hypothetical protein QJQ45_000572 [Haematococcus lacustris]